MSKTCKKCGEPLPNCIVLNGKTHNISARVFCLKCSPWKRHNTRSIIHDCAPGTYFCTRCKEMKPCSSFYKKGKSHQTYCKTCHDEIVHKRRRDQKKRAVELAGGKCKKCGYCRCIEALDFHHLDGSTKEFIGKGIEMKSWPKVVEEVGKCVLLCATCHREEHNGFKSF